MTPLFQKIKEILYSSRNPKNSDLDDKKNHEKRIQRWEKECGECIQQEKAKANSLTHKYCLAPNDFAIIEVPTVTHGNASNTAIMLILSPDDFTKVIKGENIAAIEMIMTDPLIVFSDSIPRIFYGRIDNLKIFTDTSFSQNSFFRNIVWRALLYEVQNITGKVISTDDFMNHLRETGKIFFDPVSNENVINIFLEFGKRHFIGIIPIITDSSKEADS